MCMFICHFSHAQKMNPTSVISMHDGSVYTGEIVSEDAFEIELKTDAIGIIYIPKNLVEKRKNSKDLLLVPQGKYHKKKGNFFAIDMGLGYGVHQYSFRYGKRITPKIQLGVGTTFSFVTFDVPVFSQVQSWIQPHIFGRYYINDKKWRLFADAKLGYGFQDLQGSSDGIYINPGIGFEIANRKNMKWSLKLSQFIQDTSIRDFWIDSFNNPVELNSDILYNRTTLTVGISF